MSAHDEQQAKLLERAANLPLVGSQFTEGFVSALKAGAAALRRASPETGWQPIETLTADYKGQFVAYWQKSLVGEPSADMMGGWDEYQTILGFGEPPATHWLPVLPPAPRPQEAE